MSVVDYKCPSCTAPLKFNPKSQKWDCDYCGSTYKLEDLKKNDQKYEKKQVKKVDFDTYRCPDCGAEIIADKNTTATFCLYCKNTAIIKDRLVGSFEPDKIIPFQKNKDDAIEAFKKVTNRKPLAPKEFSKKENIDEMSGVYIPFWLYDIKANGNISGKATKVTSWISGDYSYTRTDTFSIGREGYMNFLKVPFDGSTRFDDAIMNSIEPFDYSQLKDFNHSYLSGFYSEKYDVDDKQGLENVKIRVKNSVEDVLRSEIRGYSTVSIAKGDVSLDDIKTYYVLLPVWMLNIKYKDKIYTFAMNGQTGKMIGNIPVDRTKVVVYSIIIFIIVFIVSFVIILVKNGIW